MSDDMEQINFTVDRNAKELAKDKLDYGELSEELRDTVNEIAYGKEVSKREETERKLAQLREDKDKKRAEIRQAQTDLEEIEGEIKRLERELDGMERKEDKYEATLEMLEETLYAGGRVFEEHGQVQKAAKMGETEPTAVINELQERNPSIPSHAFVDKMEVTKEWSGIDN